MDVRILCLLRTNSALTVDLSGNALIVSSTASVILALTWGGVTYPWTSARVLVPLLVGFAVMAGFLVYEHHIERVDSKKIDTDEIKKKREPTVPLRLLGNRTSLSG